MALQRILLGENGPAPEQKPLDPWGPIPWLPNRRMLARVKRATRSRSSAVILPASGAFTDVAPAEQNRIYIAFSQVENQTVFVWPVMDDATETGFPVVRDRSPILFWWAEHPQLVGNQWRGLTQAGVPVQLQIWEVLLR